jgi:hypothetical protein
LPNPVLYEKLKDREQKEKSLFERNENKKKIPSHTDTFPESREKSFYKEEINPIDVVFVIPLPSIPPPLVS